jgi:hypothetical protein
VLQINADKLAIPVKSYVEKGNGKGLAEMSTALAEHRLIKMINLSIFGFSRGAALARAFSNGILKDCKTNSDGAMSYHNFPIRINFLGLFDTVASFGLPANNMDAIFSEKNLTVDDRIEKCVHYVAAHELRFSFPIDLIRKRGKLPTKWIEEAYPGVHSDVGGGYEPVSQEISNNYARIPLRDMMSEALRAGVRMLGQDDLKKRGEAQFSRFAIEPATQKSYDAYMGHVQASGTMEDKITQHMKALYSAYGTMSRRGITTPDQLISKGSAGHHLIGHVGIAREADALQNTGSALGLLQEQAGKAIAMGSATAVAAMPQGLQFIGTVYSQIVRPEAWRLQAWNQNASDSVLNFVKNSVHDSKGDFIMSVEPFSYFRARGMAESSHNVLAQGKQWIDETSKAIKAGVIKIYHRAEGVVVETWQHGKLITTKTYRIGEKFVVDTVHAGEKYAVEVYQSGKEVVITTMAAGQRMIVSSIDAAQKTASSMLDSAQKSASKVAQQAGKSARQLSDHIGETASDGMKVIEHGWMSTKSALGL